MKLLFDENLSRRLVTAVADLFPDSAHVTTVGLTATSDRDVWDHARVNGYVLVSKDSDLNDLAFVHGAPPKIVWLRIGNATTIDIVNVLRDNTQRIIDFGDHPDDAVLILDH
ncbi:MAG: DUF5615 family PIN-like protein [Desertimonas sp.]